MHYWALFMYSGMRLVLHHTTLHHTTTLHYTTPHNTTLTYQKKGIPSVGDNSAKRRRVGLFYGRSRDHEFDWWRHGCIYSIIYLSQSRSPPGIIILLLVLFIINTSIEKNCRAYCEHFVLGLGWPYQCSSCSLCSIGLHQQSPVSRFGWYVPIKRNISSNHSNFNK